MKNIPSDQAFTIYHRLLIGFSLHSTSVPDCITDLHRSAHCFNIHQHKSPCDNRGIYVRSEKLVCTCVRQMNGQPTVAGTDKHNSLIFIRSKTPLYLVMTDQSASSTASMPIIPAFKILTGTCTAPNLFSSHFVLLGTPPLRAIHGLWLAETACSSNSLRRVNSQTWREQMHRREFGVSSTVINSRIEL